MTTHRTVTVSSVESTMASDSGCQCQSAGFSTWNDALIEQAGRFVEAQLDVFEGSSSGYLCGGLRMRSSRIPSLVGGILGSVGRGRRGRGEGRRELCPRRFEGSMSCIHFSVTDML